MRSSFRRSAALTSRRMQSTWAPEMPEPPVFQADPSRYSGVELTFLGTASQVCARRHPSSLAMRLRGHHNTHTWLFDAGEGSLSQIQRSHLRVSQLRNIFITHMHPDHVFGLPGIVMSALSTREAHNSRVDSGSNSSVRIPPLTVYGPPGIRCYLRSSLGATLPSFREPNLLRIVELAVPKEVLASWKFNGVRPYWNSHVRRLPFEEVTTTVGAETDPVTGAVTFDLLKPRVVKPELDVLRMSDTQGKVMRNGQVSTTGGEADISKDFAMSPAFVKASIVSHSVPSIAYVVTENVSDMRFDKQKLRAMGLPVDGGHPGVQAVFQRLLAGQPAEFEGRTIMPEDVSRSQRIPRTVCIVGDTSDASGVAHLAQNADLLVHEATLRATETDIARKRGHSSSTSAANFAKSIGAKRLVLNHTSVAYNAHEVRALEAEARRVLGSNSAYVAHDMSVFNVPSASQDELAFPFRTFLGHPRWDYPELLRNASILHELSISRHARPSANLKSGDRPEESHREPGGRGVLSKQSSSEHHTAFKVAAGDEIVETETASIDDTHSASSVSQESLLNSSREMLGSPYLENPRRMPVASEPQSPGQEFVAAADVQRKQQFVGTSHVRQLESHPGLNSNVSKRMDSLETKGTGKRLLLESADYSAPLRSFRNLRRSFAAV